MKQLLLFIIFNILALNLSVASDNKPLVYKININDEIGKSTWHQLQNGLLLAKDKKADYVLIEMNTYGGFVTEADSMRTAILNSTIPVYVFINNNAASAGALIALACDKIYMTPSANIGAATVVNETGEKAPDKYQSYMRSLMRSTAESYGKDSIIDASGKVSYKWKRDPLIAEAMVDERVQVPILMDSTKVLTLTSTEALEVGFCDGIAKNITEITGKYMNLKDYTIETYQPTTFDYIKDFLTNRIVQSILIMIIVGGIYIEIKTPGVGLPIAVAITAALLYFTPLYMDGYAQNWEIIIFVLGLILIAFEVFVIPGFGVAGIGGIILVITGLFLSMIGNVDFDFKPVPPNQIGKSLLTVITGIVLGVAFIIFAMSRIGKERSLLKNIALSSDQEGYSSVSEEPKLTVGKIGVSATVLRPSGRVIIDADMYDAVAAQGFIDKDKKIKVQKYENAQLYVVEIKD